MLVWIVTCHTYITTHLYTRKWAIGEGPFIWVKIPIPCEPSPTIHTLNDASHLMVLVFHVEDLLTELTKANKAHKLPHLGASGGPFALPWLLPHPVPSAHLFEKFANMVSSKTICCDAPIKQAYSSNKMNENHQETYFLVIQALGNFPTHGKNALEHQKFQNHLLQGTNQSSLIPPKMIKTLK